MINIKLNIQTAELMGEALRTVLENCDVHSDEAALLENLSNRIEFLIQKAEDDALDYAAMAQEI